MNVNILSLFFAFGILILPGVRNFFSGPICLVFHRLLVCIWPSLSLYREVFFYNFVEYVCWPFEFEIETLC